MTPEKPERLAYHVTKATVMAAQTAGAAVPAGWVAVVRPGPDEPEADRPHIVPAPPDLP